MKRTTCGACGYDDLELFLDLGQSPIADAYTTSPDELSPMYPLQLAVCTGCWLVQLLEVVNHEVLFGTGYSFYSSASTPLSEYHRAYADDVLSTHSARAKRLTVEIGCNDGDLLRHFEDAGCPTVGVDPARGPVQVAMQRVSTVVQDPFGRHVAELIREEYGPAGVIIANHVLAHVESVADVLDGIQYLLADDGVVYVEVQYLPDLLVNNAFDLVYHEHRNFFSLSSLTSAVERWGLRVCWIGFTARQGGSLRVILTRSQPPVWTQVHAGESWLRQVETYRGFQGRVDRIRERLETYIGDAAPVLGYGAPAKATTLLNYCRLDPTWVDQIIDTTSAKQGRLLPGRQIPIVAPEDVNLDDYDAVLLLSWNYVSQIMRQHRDYRGDWIIPIPAPVVL